MLGGAGGIGHLERAAQRVARRNALEGHQLAGAPLRITGPPHGRKAHGAHGLQAQRLGLVHKGLGRGVVAGDHDIAAQQLQGVALQPALEPVRKKTHRGERGHGQRDGHHQQTQFTRAQVAQQGAPPKAQERQFHRGQTLAQLR